MNLELITRWCETDCYIDWEYVVEHQDSNGDTIFSKTFTDYDMAVNHIRINSRR